MRPAVAKIAQRSRHHLVCIAEQRNGGTNQASHGFFCATARAVFLPFNLLTSRTQESIGAKLGVKLKKSNLNFIDIEHHVLPH
jgi:hypothetical protein